MKLLHKGDKNVTLYWARESEIQFKIDNWTRWAVHKTRVESISAKSRTKDGVLDTLLAWQLYYHPSVVLIFRAELIWSGVFLLLNELCFVLYQLLQLNSFFSSFDKKKKQNKTNKKNPQLSVEFGDADKNFELNQNRAEIGCKVWNNLQHLHIKTTWQTSINDPVTPV